MKSRIFLVTSILLLTLQVKSFACGPWYYDPQTYFMYRPYSFPSEGWEYNTGAKENCLLWQKECKTTASSDDIYQIVYKTSLEDLNSLLHHSFKGRKLTKSNAFARALWNDKEAAELLVLAKECELARSDLNSPWYYPASKDERPFGLDRIADKAGKYKGSRLRNRYALQRIRALFSLMDYDECINYWNDVSTSMSGDIIKTLAERYVAGAYYRIGEVETAKDYYLRLGDIEDLYFCFRNGKTPWEEVLYQYAPDCKELREWISSQIKYEESLFYDTYDDYWKDGTVPGEDAARCEELARFCARLASEGKVQDPDFWYYSQAYLLMMTGKPGEASSLLSEAAKSDGTKEMKDNIRVFKLYLDSVLKPWSQSYENEMIEGLKWLDGMIITHLDEARRETIEGGVYKMGINLSYYYWNDMMRKIVLSAIVPKLLKNHRETSAIRFANMADNRLLNLVGKSRVWYLDKNGKDWVEEDLTMKELRTGSRFNEHDYSNALFELIDTLDVIHLERYVSSLGKVGTKTDTFLEERGYADKAFFQEIIGTKHIREMRYKDAVKWLSMLPKGFQTRLNTYKHGYLDLDPFTQSKQKLKNNSEYKLSFARKMVELESAIAKEKNPSEKARKTAQYATGMRNSVSICWGMSFYRKSVADIDTEYFGPSYFSRKQDVAFSKSEKLFQQAIRNCPDRETAASILYELGNMKTVAENYPETKSAAVIKGECDKLVDYHLERRGHYVESYGNGPYEFEKKAATTIKY